MDHGARLALLQAALGAVRLLFFAQREAEAEGLVPRAHTSRRIAELGERLATAAWVAEVGSADEREAALQDAAGALSEVWNLDALGLVRGLLSPVIYRIQGVPTPVNDRRWT